MDIFDQATEIEEREREASVARVRAQIRDESEAGRVVTLTCLECGSPIDPRRVRALPHVTTCIDCAQAAEHAAKLRRDP